MAQNVRINFSVSNSAAQKNLNSLANTFKKLQKSGEKLKFKKASADINRLSKNVQKSNEFLRTHNNAYRLLEQTNNKVAKSSRRAATSMKKTNVQLQKQTVVSKTAAAGMRTLALNVGALVSAYAGLTVIGSTVRKTADFSKALAEVQTIANETPEQLGKIRGEVLQLSAATGKKPADLARAFYQIQSAGITDTAAASDVLKNSTQLAIGGLADLESTINAVTKVLSVYKGEFQTSAEITDVLFKSVKLGQVRVEELAMGLPQVISLGRSLGLSFSEVSGAAAAMSKRAGTAALGFTQLRSVFSGVIRGQARAKALLGENAEAFSIQALRSKGLAKFLRDVNVAAKGNQTTLFKLFGRVEALTGVTAGAADNFQDLEKIIKKTAKTSKDSEKAFDEIADSVGGLLDKIAAKGEVLQLVVGVTGEDVLIRALQVIDGTLLKLIENFQTAARWIKSTLITVGVVAFTHFQIRGVAAMVAMRAEFIAMRAQAVNTMSGMKIGMLAFAKSVHAARISIKGLKIAVTFGLSLILDAVIFKLLEMKEQFGGWNKVFKIFEFWGKIAFKKLELYVDELILKFWEMRQAVADFINKGLVKFGNAVGKIFGVDIAVQSVQAFNGKIKESKENVRGTTEELVALEKRLEKFKVANVKSDKDILGGLGGDPKKVAEGLAGGTTGTANVPGLPSEQAVADKLQSVRDQILLFNEETRLILNERAMLAKDEDFAFLQERLGTEKAIKAVARKQALINLKKGKKAELEFEKKIAEEKKKQALAEIKFAELSNQEKLKATQNTLSLMLGLTQAAGSKFFAVGKAVAVSESIVAGILAVQKALASGPYPLNLVNASIIGATTALNTAKIASSKPPSFRTGGFVPGIPTGGRDSVLAQVEPQEFVATRQMQKNLVKAAQGEISGDAGAIDAINKLAAAIMGQETVVEIDGRQVALAVRDQKLAGVRI